MAFDYKKEYREFYKLPKKPGIVDVPEMYFILLAKRHMNEEKSWEHRSQLFSLSKNPYFQEARTRSWLQYGKNTA